MVVSTDVRELISWNFQCFFSVLYEKIFIVVIQTQMLKNYGTFFFSLHFFFFCWTVIKVHVRIGRRRARAHCKGVVTARGTRPEHVEAIGS